MKKLIILSAGLILLASTVWAAELQQARLKTVGMTCSVCTAKMKKELKDVCQEVKIDLPKGEVLCAYQAPVTVEQIVNEANKTGFKTTVWK